MGQNVRIPPELGRLVVGPVPILEEGKLDRQDGRPRDLDVGVAPVPELGVLSHVLVADIVTADPRGVPIDDDDLAVVAEVDLEAIAGPLAGMEIEDVNSGVAELFDVACWQFVAADLVVQEMHLSSRPSSSSLTMKNWTRT